MDAHQLAREAFDVFQDIRAEVHALERLALLAGSDLAGRAAVAAARIAGMVDRAEAVVARHTGVSDAEAIRAAGPASGAAGPTAR